MKPADRLRHEVGRYYAVKDAAALLDECERVLARLDALEDLSEPLKPGEPSTYDDPTDINAVRADMLALLAKLRGEA